MEHGWAGKALQLHPPGTPVDYGRMRGITIGTVKRQRWPAPISEGKRP
jgi:hypothetical protein